MDNQYSFNFKGKTVVITGAERGIGLEIAKGFARSEANVAVEYYVSKGWDREKAESFVIQRHLSHSGERQDLKKIYLYS